MSSSSIGIVGCGPWGLAVLERLLARFIGTENVNHHLFLHIFEPNQPGVGVYSNQLPEYLLLNTECGQIDLFGYKFFEDSKNILEDALSFYEWLQAYQHQYQWHDYKTTRSIRPNDFLPRKWLGNYLNWVFEKLTTNLPDNITLYIHRNRVSDIRREGNHERVIMNNGESIHVESVVITIGHAEQVILEQKASDDWVAGAYLPAFPQNRVNDIVKPNETVAITGMGLTATDVISYLTVGRGGSFSKKENGQLVYHPSGNEPRIIQCSRSGLAYLSRPFKVSDISGSYRPLFLTKARVDLMKRKKEGHIDFRKDVLPLLFCEMKCLYYKQQAGITNEDFKGEFKNNGFWGYEGAFGLFSPEKSFFGDLGELASSNSYQDQIIRLLEMDVKHSCDDIEAPEKNALELLRILRGLIRECTDFEGLTETSAVDFHEFILPLIYRAVVGPPVQKTQELLALVQSGIVQQPLGPSPTFDFDRKKGKWRVTSSQLHESISFELDHVIAGYLDLDVVSRPKSGLINEMLNQGRFTPNRLKNGRVKGIKINHSFQPIRSNNGVEENLFVLGLLTDGTRNFNLYVPSPRSRFQAFADADFCISRIAERKGWIFQKKSK